jgi:hypothetical protein
MTQAKTIKFDSRRPIDAALIRKLQRLTKVEHDGLTGLSRRLLHSAADKLIQEHKATNNAVYAQPARAG